MDKDARDKYFSDLMKRTYDKVYMFVVKGCKNREFAEDVVQETFYEAYRKIDILMVHPNQMGWLYETAKHKWMKLYSKGKDFELVDGEIEYFVTKNGDMDEYEAVELAETIKSFLSEAEYDMLRDYYLNGYSSVEVADKYGLDRGGIRMRITRLKRKLKDDLVVGWLIFAVCIWRLV